MKNTGKGYIKLFSQENKSIKYGGRNRNIDRSFRAAIRDGLLLGILDEKEMLKTADSVVAWLKGKKQKESVDSCLEKKKNLK